MFKKKLITLALVASMAVTTLVGCGELEDTDVISVVDGEDITVGVANYYMRMQQAMMETYYAAYMGEDMWTTDEGDGTTYQDSMKDRYMMTLQEYYLARQHAEELGVTLTEEELAAIETVADTFVEENSEEVRAKVSGTKENIAEYLQLQAIQLKVYDVVGEGADTEVSDEEAAQKKMSYVYYSFNSTDEDGATVTMTDEEKAETKEAAEALIKEAKASKEDSLYATASQDETLMASETTFNATTSTLDEKILEVVDTLEEGEYTDVIETDSGYYIAQLTSLLDREATDTEKERIISERQTALYEETVAKWREDVDVTLNAKMLSQIDFEDLSVTMYVEPTEIEE